MSGKGVVDGTFGLPVNGFFTAAISLLTAGCLAVTFDAHTLLGIPAHGITPLITILVASSKREKRWTVQERPEFTKCGLRIPRPRLLGIRRSTRD